MSASTGWKLEEHIPAIVVRDSITTRGSDR